MKKNTVKRVTIIRKNGTEEYQAALRTSALEAKTAILGLSEAVMPIELLYKLKFDRIGRDPLDSSRSLNFIEQLNQTFTYMASFGAADIVFERHPRINTIKLNLGTTSGWDIESDDDGGLVAEVFASVAPSNNGKLASAIARVTPSTAQYRYVFFMCPGIAPGPVPHSSETPSIVVWSLGRKI